MKQKQKTLVLSPTIKGNKQTQEGLPSSPVDAFGVKGDVQPSCDNCTAPLKSERCFWCKDLNKWQG